MSIYKDIEKATQIPCTDSDALFVRLKGSKKPKNQLNRCRPKGPQNENFLEDDSSESYSDTQDDYLINENEIAASIKVANGGVSYSNDILERHWKSAQLETTSNSNNSEVDVFSFDKSEHLSTNGDDTTVKDNNVSTLPVKTKSDINFEDKVKVLEKCKLSKNAAILGLLKNDKISLEDLQIPGSQNDGNVDCECSASTKDGNEAKPNIPEEKYKMQLVECPEEPDVFVQPLQAYGTIDESKYKDIDFSVEHIGKKKVVTPRQFYLYNIDDTVFDFVKKTPKKK